ncbi:MULTISPECIES: S-layer homology domain-containing protein [unclassified Paenibacillus]|uniref:S-layer homology domain-containing protein n=1 Tax=unclassified Paenibacillus TaxID=185978 RepID=UPI003637BDB1
MNTLKKALSSILVALMLTALLPVAALAANSVAAQATGSAAITVTTSTYGQLQSVVNATNVPYLDVNSLTVTAGLLNSTDIKFINEKLTNLAILQVIGTADFVDSTLPSKAFEGNKSLQTVKLLNTKILQSRVFYQAIAAEGGNLKTVELPKVTSIADRAFYRSPIKALIMGEVPPTMIGSKGGDEGYWFKEATGDVKIYVPTPEAIEKYENVFAFEGFVIKVIGDNSDDGQSGPIDTYGYTGYGNGKVVPRKNAYYTGDYKLSLNFYSFNSNLNAWKSKWNVVPQTDPLALNPLDAIQWAKNAGFDAVDVTEYYIPGYDDKLTEESAKPAIMDWARKIKAKAKEVGIAISGTGAQNNFVQPSDEKRAIDMERYKFWIDVAAEMGAPVIRVFAGATPSDAKQLGWEKIAKERLVPHLKELAAYGAAKGVQIGLQNHGDFTSTADQIIQIIKWVDHPNIGIIDDTGYFRPFRGSALDYNWYADINAVLPYSNNFQVKKKPAGAETKELMDLNRLFTGVRSSDYRGFIPAELLWNPGDVGHPSTLTTPPYEEVSGFLAKMKEAMEKSKTSGKIGMSTLSANDLNQSVGLSWTPSPQATQGYFVKRKMNDNTYKLVGTVGAATYSFTETGLTNYQTYTYVVTGFDSEREYAESNEVSARPYKQDSHSTPSRGTSGGGSGGGPVSTGTDPASGSNSNVNKDGVKLDAATVKEKVGDKTVNRVIINSESLNKAIDAIKNNQSGQQKITIQVEGKEPVALVQLTADAWLNAQNSAAGIVLSIKSDTSTYDLPIKALSADIITKLLNGDAKNNVINIQIEKISGPLADEISKKAAQSGLNLLGDMVDYKITANVVEVADFNGVYVSRSLALPNSVDDKTTTVLLYNPSTGKFSFVPAIFNNSGSQVTFKRSGNSIYTIAQNRKTFSDISTHWAKNDIELLASKLVVEGSTDQLFTPDKSITRAEFASLLVRSLGLNPVKDGIFKDVNSDIWYSETVNAAAKAGLVNGFEGDNFKPNDTITREQMAVMISRAIDFTGNKAKGSLNSTSSFTDSGMISSWAQAAVAAAVNAKIINGVSDTTFVPSANATRAEATVMLKRLLQYVQFIN